MSEIVNKVANSSLITINLESFLPKNLCGFDLKPFLFMEMILKEKDYRQALKEHDWTIYENKTVFLYCSIDAIIPHWAYMLASIYLDEVQAQVHFGTEKEITDKLFIQNIEQINAQDFTDLRLVIKGCGDEKIGTNAYVAITKKLKPVAKSIMYGEPCSTVPIYKQKRTI
jgi:hypothetical protein